MLGEHNTNSAKFGASLPNITKKLCLHNGGDASKEKE
jgi:hypothetical protein